MGVGYSGVADFANTYPGTSLSVQANVADGWGNAVGGSEVIVEFGVTPTDYYFELEDDSGVMLMESSGKLLLEIS